MSRSRHDGFVKSTFTDLACAAGELQAILPAPFVKAADWKTLQVERSERHSRMLTRSQTDILYSVAVRGSRMRVFVIFEHQSTPDFLMPYRMLGYQMEVWQSHLRQHPNDKKLPVVLGSVLCNAPGGWTAPRRMSDLFGLDDDPEFAAAVAPYLPNFDLLMDDLADFDEDMLRARALPAGGQLALLALRLPSQDELADAVQRWGDLLGEVAGESRLRAESILEQFFSYILSRWEVPSELRGQLRAINPKVEEAYMTTAEKLINEGLVKGLAKGRTEGRNEGRAHVLLKQLELRFGTQTDATRERVMNATEAELDLWTERILTATTAESLFE